MSARISRRGRSSQKLTDPLIPLNDDQDQVSTRQTRSKRRAIREDRGEPGLAVQVDNTNHTALVVLEVSDHSVTKRKEHPEPNSSSHASPHSTQPLSQVSPPPPSSLPPVPQYIPLPPPQPHSSSSAMPIWQSLIAFQSVAYTWVKLPFTSVYSLAIHPLVRRLYAFILFLLKKWWLLASIPLFVLGPWLFLYYMFEAPWDKYPLHPCNASWSPHLYEPCDSWARSFYDNSHRPQYISINAEKLRNCSLTLARVADANVALRHLPIESKTDETLLSLTIRWLIDKPPTYEFSARSRLDKELAEFSDEKKILIKAFDEFVLRIGAMIDWAYMEMRAAVIKLEYYEKRRQPEFDSCSSLIGRFACPLITAKNKLLLAFGIPLPVPLNAYDNLLMSQHIQSLYHQLNDLILSSPKLLDSFAASHRHLKSAEGILHNEVRELVGSGELGIFAQLFESQRRVRLQRYNEKRSRLMDCIEALEDVHLWVYMGMYSAEQLVAGMKGVMEMILSVQESPKGYEVEEYEEGAKVMTPIERIEEGAVALEETIIRWGL